MPRRRPIHLSEDANYIVRETHLPHPVSRPEDYALIGAPLPAVLKRTGADLLGDCWMPDTIRLGLQIEVTRPSSSVPVRHCKSFEGMSADNSTGDPGVRPHPDPRDMPDTRDQRID